MKLITIIIPCFNRVNLLPKTIKSFKEQTYQNFEIILVDGGSTDGTQDYLEAICKDDSRFKWIQKPAELLIGPSSSRNLAIKLAQGDFICFADDDDLQHPESLERRLAIFDSHPDLLYVSCNKLNFANDHELDNNITFNSKNHGYFDASRAFDYVARNIWMNTACPLIRKEFFKENQYLEDLYYGDDWEFNLRLLISGKGYQLPDQLIYHRRHVQSTTVSLKNNSERFESGLRARLYGFEFLRKKGLLSNEIVKLLSKHFLKQDNQEYFIKYVALSKAWTSEIRLKTFWILIHKFQLKRVLNYL
jgi:glycosyltransferase involved in cell wall biosynthesis